MLLKALPVASALLSCERDRNACVGTLNVLLNTSFITVGCSFCVCAYACVCVRLWWFIYWKQTQSFLVISQARLHWKHSDIYVSVWKHDCSLLHTEVCSHGLITHSDSAVRILNPTNDPLCSWAVRLLAGASVGRLVRSGSCWVFVESESCKLMPGGRSWSLQD